jgi:hypothetical protein
MTPDAPIRRLSGPVQSLVEELALEGFAPAQIERELTEKGIRPAFQPSRRTLQRIVQAVRVKDRSGPWSLGDAVDDEADLVLPVLRAYLNLTSLRTVQGKRDLFITKAEARWIVKVARAAPDLHVFDKYRLAVAYLARETRGQATYDLDALLAFQPWDDSPRPAPGDMAKFGFTVTLRTTYQKGVREGWIPAAPPFLMQELAGIEWLPKSKDEWDTYRRALYAHEPGAYEDAAVSSESEADNVGAPPATAVDAPAKGGRDVKARKR